MAPSALGPLTRMATLLVILGLAGTATAATIVVDGNGGGDYLTIQDGINAALDGDTIEVRSGTYIEDVLVNKQLTIIAVDGPSATTILPSTSSPGSGTLPDFDTTTHVIRITAAKVTIDGFTLDGDNPLLPNNPDARTGIITDSRVGATNDLTVQNCVIKNIKLCGIWALDAGAGIVLTANTLGPINVDPGVSTGIAAGNATVDITTNNLSNCALGIVLTLGTNGNIQANSITASEIGVAIYGNSGAVTVLNNRAIGCVSAYRTAQNDAGVVIQENQTLGCTTSIEVMGDVDPTATIDVVGNIVDGLTLIGSVGVNVTTVIPFGGEGLVNATIRRNAIFRCETAVLAEEIANTASTLLTISGAVGEENHFFGTTGSMLELNGCDDDIVATNNFWGTTDLSLIETLVVHKVDNPLLGYVDFSTPTPESPLLTLIGDPIIGQPITINLAGFYLQDYFMLFSIGSAEIPFPPYGTLLLDPSFLRVMLASSIPFGNVASLPGVIPDDGSLVGATIYFQALVGFDFTAGIGALSNALPMTIEGIGP